MKLETQKSFGVSDLHLNRDTNSCVVVGVCCTGRPATLERAAAAAVPYAAAAAAGLGMGIMGPGAAGTGRAAAAALAADAAAAAAAAAEPGDGALGATTEART